MIAVMSVFCLSFHATYACRHAGACCTQAWDIPVETDVAELVRGGSVVVDGGPRQPLLVPRSNADDGFMLGRRAEGACVFFEPERGRLCAIHRQAGPERLPSACRHFPRVVLRDPRGTFVTMSHFCPTAAALLVDPAGMEVVEAPVSISLGGSLEGLDATAVLPPLLRPGVLVDYDGLSEWERAGLAVLDRDDLDAERALDIISAATREVASWAPGRESLASAVRRAFSRALRGELSSRGKCSRPDRSERAFLAAHLFANWAAYESGGLLGVLDNLREVLATLRRHLRKQESFVDVVRGADLELRHADKKRGGPVSASGGSAGDRGPDGRRPGRRHARPRPAPVRPDAEGARTCSSARPDRPAAAAAPGRLLSGQRP